MRSTASFLLLALLVGCAPNTTDQITRGEPYRSYASTRPRDDVAQCIARALPNTNVIPGRAETVVNQWNFEGPLLFSWVITDAAGGGSTIRAWRANSIAGGIRRAEACF